MLGPVKYKKYLSMEVYITTVKYSLSIYIIFKVLSSHNKWKGWSDHIANAEAGPKVSRHYFPSAGREGREGRGDRGQDGVDLGLPAI